MLALEFLVVSMSLIEDAIIGLSVSRFGTPIFWSGSSVVSGWRSLLTSSPPNIGLRSTPLPIKCQMQDEGAERFRVYEKVTITNV